jgi:hypothetical protein
MFREEWDDDGIRGVREEEYERSARAHAAQPLQSAGYGYHWFGLHRFAREKWKRMNEVKTQRATYKIFYRAVEDR